ncbi:MAG: ankyrin repeat domain-containing protein [Pseudomonadota bacterium]
MGQEAFWEAIKAGDAEAVLRALDAAPELLELRLPSGHGPIRLAAECGHGALATALADRGTPDPFDACLLGRLDILEAVEPDAITSLRSGDGWSLLHLAAFAGRVDVIRHLAGAGADIAAVSANPMANEPLHAALAGACAPEAVGALLAAGADANAVAGAGITPLHLAASRGSDAAVDVLLAAGARVAAMEDGRTPADLATERGFPALGQRLAALAG